MKRLILLLTIAALTCFGCATYKQLKPKTLLSFAEQGYIELKKDEKGKFELKKEKSYFIEFPPSSQENFYLILSLPDKKKIDGFFTASLNRKKTPGKLISDETPYPDSVSVFPISTGSTAYFWCIKNVPQDMELSLKYRYAPQWRFKFETHHARFKGTLEKNRVDRTVYEKISNGYNWQSFNFTVAIDTIQRNTAGIIKVKEELIAIESIFPAGVVNSSDEAYLNYKKLRENIEDEIAFQQAYTSALKFFLADAQTRANPKEFLARIDEFTAYFEKKNVLARNVLLESQSVIKRRVDELVPFYKEIMSSKPDASVLDTSVYRLGGLAAVPALLESAGVVMDAGVKAVHRFVLDFQKSSIALVQAHAGLAYAVRSIESGPPMPGDDFFPPLVEKINTVVSSIPDQIDAGYGEYSSFDCARKLNAEIEAENNDAKNWLNKSRDAASLVSALNQLKTRQEWRGMIAMIRQNPHLDFLPSKYRELDRLSIELQTSAIKGSLEASSWRLAEEGLRNLYADDIFIDVAAVSGIRQMAVLDLEDSLYTRIERVTRSRVMRFAEERASQIDNIDSLYTDSVFFPVYDVTFSTGSKRELIERKNQLAADLAAMKENEFPARAVKLLFEQFIKNPDDNGVLKARAVVAHGRYYQGKDKDTKARIAECDPLTAKWIVKPKEYRRVFAIPVTDSRRGKNKYMIRLNVNIPTEAMFPVYDVNIKLPREIAANAAASQWYDAISINKSLIKNEGRFSISAPAAANDYECQVTPVQMNKDKANVLEITFTHDSFKVLPVSVMVQKPIIKKN